MDIYNYAPTTGEYLSTAPADPDPLQPGQYLVPAYATTTAPPDIPDGSAARWTGADWELVEDHRGEQVYRTATTQPMIISDLGELPDGVTPLAPSKYPVWDAKAKTWTTDLNALADARRNERDARIAAIMWRVQRYESEVRQGVTETTDNIAVLDEYIQKLRDVPNQHGFPKTVEWPEAPNPTD